MQHGFVRRARAPRDDAETNRLRGHKTTDKGRSSVPSCRSPPPSHTIKRLVRNLFRWVPVLVLFTVLISYPKHTFCLYGRCWGVVTFENPERV